MTTSQPSDSFERRRASDEAIEESRRAGDQERDERRQVRDRIRQQSRSGGQVRARLKRERALDDASLEGERNLVDRKRAQERSRSDQDSRRHAALLEAAEDRLGDAREEEDAAALERRQTLRAAGADLARLDVALAEIQARSEGSDPALTAEVEAALACAGRLGRVLARALDVEDLLGDHHDVGGSG